MILTTFISIIIIAFYLYCLIVMTKNLSKSIHYKKMENIFKNILIILVIFLFYITTIVLTLQNNTMALLVILFITLLAITITITTSIITHFKD